MRQDRDANLPTRQTVIYHS